MEDKSINTNNKTENYEFCKGEKKLLIYYYYCYTVVLAIFILII